jgi:two-component system sensor histidine kinase UhpB
MVRELVATDAARRRFVPLFWRLFVPNACVLVVACVVLILAPPNGRVPILVAGLGLLLVTDLVLMRWAFSPLQRLFGVMRRIDPLAPGRRLSIDGPESEVTELTRAFNEMLDRVEYERRDSARRALSAQEAERRHVAHELHDEIGQTLTALMLELDRVARIPPAQMPAAIEYLKATTAGSLDDVRRIARRLRPEALDDLGLGHALYSLCDRIEQPGGPTVRRSIDRDLPRLSSDGELVIYRIAQESMTNALRHGEAESIELELRRTADCVRLRVADDGCGFDFTALNQFGGIRGMRERALLIGARLEIDSAPGGGTTVMLAVDPDEERR